MTTRETQDKDLGGAIEAMRRGQPVARRAWAVPPGKGERWFTAYVILLAPVGLLKEREQFGGKGDLWREKEAVLFQVTYGGNRMPWSPEARDVLADDWYVYTGDPAPAWPTDEPQITELTPQ